MVWMTGACWETRFSTYYKYFRVAWPARERPNLVGWGECFKEGPKLFGAEQGTLSYPQYWGVASTQNVLQPRHAVGCGELWPLPNPR